MELLVLIGLGITALLGTGTAGIAFKKYQALKTKFLAMLKVLDVVEDALKDGELTEAEIRNIIGKFKETL